MRLSKQLTDRIISSLVRFICWAAHITPPSFGLTMGRMLGFIAYLMDARHRNIVRVNLKFAFQDTKTDREIDRLVYQNFMQWGMIAYEWGRKRFFNRLPPCQLPIRVETSGEVHLREARKKSAAVILLSAHFGNWEYGHLHYGCQINSLNFIVRRIDNPHLEPLRVNSNTRHGITILYKQKGLKAAIKSLKKGEDLVIFADQKANPKEGIKCRFFDRETTTLPIVATLAKKYKYPIIPMFVVRNKDWVSHKIIFMPELTFNDDDSIEEIAQRQNDIIETIIRKHPDHWLWLHRKWKTEYPELYKRT